MVTPFSLLAATGSIFAPPCIQWIGHFICSTVSSRSFPFVGSTGVARIWCDRVTGGKGQKTGPK